MVVRQTTPIHDRIFYDAQARAYQETLPLEHYMESPHQQMQRRITLASFDLIHAARPDIWCHNELLVQYPQSDVVRDIGRVVPDNLILVAARPIQGRIAFNTPYEAGDMVMAMEYVSEESKKKDFETNMTRYERLKIGHYLIFDPVAKTVHLFKRSRVRKAYLPVKPKRSGRYPVPPLELEMGVYDDWLRYWFRGRLLPLPGELDEQLTHANDRLREVELDAKLSDGARRNAERQAKKEQAAREAADAAREAADVAREAAEDRARREHAARQVAEAELAALRAELDKLKKPK